MKKFLVFAAAVAGLLALSAPAQAKEVLSMKVCGASGCVTSTDSSVLKGWETGNQDPSQIWQTNPAGYYRVTLGLGEQGKVMGTQGGYWLPGRNLMRWQGQYGYPWWKLFPSQVKMLRSVAGNLTPITPTLSSVKVGGKSVADPSSYLRLLGKFLEVYEPASHKHRMRIVLRAPEANPWIHSAVGLRYIPKKRLLHRPDGDFRVPKRMAGRVMRRISLSGATTKATQTHGDSTALYAGVGAAGVVGALALVLAGGAVRKARHS